MIRKVIAMNSMHSGDPRKDNRGFAETWTLEQFDQLLSEPWLAELVDRIRHGEEQLKNMLPYICPHYYRFRGNHRAQGDIVPQAFTYMTCVDVDDIHLVEMALQRALMLNEQEGGEWQGMVRRIEYSARKKLHIYLMMPVGKTIKETQEMFCDELEVPYDESCITPERFIYLTGKAEEVYRSEDWLKPLSLDELEERREAFLLRGLDVDGRPLQKPEVKPSEAPKADQSDGQKVNQPEGQKAAKAPEHVEADARTLFIFDECMKECDLKPEHLIVEGARHNSLKSILSVGAVTLLSKAQLNGVLKVRMAQNWQDQNIQQLVDDFYTKYHDEAQKLNQFQRKLFAQSLKMASQQQKEEEVVVLVQPMLTGLSQLYSSPLPPVIPEKLPRLVKLLTKNTPAELVATVAQAIFPSLGAHLKEVKFRYTDNVLHEATLMNVIMAPTSTGKGCIDEPIKRIMADIYALSEENNQRLDEFNQENLRKGANKDKKERPNNLIIQEIQSDVTHAAFVLRLKESDNRFLYSKLNEIELFDKLKGTGGQQFIIMCQAFDPENRYGQTRVGRESVNATVQIRFNWNASGTIAAVQKYFASQLTKGPISRINFCTIPEREIGAPQPVYGIYDQKFDEELRPFIKHLTEASGIIECRQARKLAKKLIAECAEFSRLSQDRVYENLSFRANVIAYLKACVLYVANGCKWESAIEEFIRWSLHYDLWTKMRYFGDAIRRAEAGQTVSKRGPKNLLELLPEHFTFQEAANMRVQEGKDRGGTQNMLNQWVHRGYILHMTDDSFKKLKYINPQE